MGFIPKFIELLEKKGFNIPKGLFKNDSQAATPPKSPAPPSGQQKKPAVKPGHSKKTKQTTSKKVGIGYGRFNQII